MNNIQDIISQKNGRLANLILCIEEISDPRIDRNLEHPLVTILMIAICAHIGGANDWVEIQHFGKLHIEWFATFLDVSNGIPSHDTFGRVFSMISNFELKFWLLLWLEDVLCKGGQQISLDGKVIKAWSSKDPLTMLNAWSTASRAIIGQIRVAPGHNEITTIKKMLKLLNLKGKVVTIDAIGTQKEIAASIVEEGGDYVLPVKRNHPTFHDDVKLFMDSVVDGQFDYVPYDFDKTLDKDHGRIETRLCYSTGYIDWMHQKKDWSHLKSLTVIEIKVEKNGVTSNHRRYFISSLEPNAPKILSIVRNHWGIENYLHRSLDVNALEDRSTIRKGSGPQNFSLLRCFVASLLSNSPFSGSIKHNKTQASHSFPFLLGILLNKGF